MAQDDADFILQHAERLVKVGTLCVISFGLAEGLNDALQARADKDDGDWQQAAAGFQDGTLMMAVMRTALLLDRDEKNVSFQTVHRRLKSRAVQIAFTDALAAKHGDDEFFPPSRAELITTFFDVYSTIDWDVHGRLTHLRNFGAAHLTIKAMSKSVRFTELRALVEIVSQLTGIIRRLCHTQTAFNDRYLEDYRDIARRSISKGLPSAVVN